MHGPSPVVGDDLVNLMHIMNTFDSDDDLVLGQLRYISAWVSLLGMFRKYISQKHIVISRIK